MTIKAKNKELDTLKADIASLREEIAGLAASEKKSGNPENPHTAEQQEAAHDEDYSGMLHKFDSSKKIRGANFIRGFTEQHPLSAIMAAFGIGYIIAKLWHQGNR